MRIVPCQTAIVDVEDDQFAVQNELPNSRDDPGWITLAAAEGDTVTNAPMAANKTPAATHPDYAAISIMGAILGDGKNSRLYRALTDKNLSTGVFTGTFSSQMPSMISVSATVGKR